MSGSPLNPLTERQQNLCEYGGVFGVLLTLTCLVQHLVVTVSNWITYSMIPFYLFIIVTFFLLSFKKTAAPVLLIASAVLALLLQGVWMLHYSFSLVVLILFLYLVVIIVSLYGEQVPAGLRNKQKAEKAEEDSWAGKI
jgi:hypothetical protein